MKKQDKLINRLLRTVLVFNIALLLVMILYWVIPYVKLAVRNVEYAKEADDKGYTLQYYENRYCFVINPTENYADFENKGEPSLKDYFTKEFICVEIEYPERDD